MSRPPLTEPVPVKIIFTHEIGEARSALEAMQLIGENWDRSDGEAISGHYEFELDEHRFLLHVVPIAKTLRTPFDE